MAVKIRLERRGRKALPFYSIVVVNANVSRNGKSLEKIGTFDPNQKPGALQLDIEAALSWLEKGAQPTKTMRDILSSQGVLLKRHLQKGVTKGVITQEIADKRFAEWQKIAAKKKRKTYQQVTNPHTNQGKQA